MPGRPQVIHFPAAIAVECDHRRSLADPCWRCELPNTARWCAVTALMILGAGFAGAALVAILSNVIGF